MRKDDQLQTFSAIIRKIGINPYVQIPARVSRYFGKRGHVSVKGTLNGFPIRTTLVPIGNGRHRLYVNWDMRKRAEVDVGDRVDWVLEIDTEPRVFPMLKEFEQALEQNKKAKVVFDRLPPSHKKEILAYLNWVKKLETLERNIGKIIDYLLKQKQK
jgi:hypothetical protein